MSRNLFHIDPLYCEMRAKLLNLAVLAVFFRYFSSSRPKTSEKSDVYTDVLVKNHACRQPLEGLQLFPRLALPLQF